MPPNSCALPGCNSNYKKEKIYIKLIKNLKFLKKSGKEYFHQKALQDVILSYRDSSHKLDNILSQIHRGQCGICERHFKANDIIVSKTGKKSLRLGALPTENLPAKSFQKLEKPPRRILIKQPLPVPVLHQDLDSVQMPIAKHFFGAKLFPKLGKSPRRILIKQPLPVPVLHKDLDSVQMSIAKHFFGKKGIDWNFSFHDRMIVCRYKTDVSSHFEVNINSDFKFHLFHHGLRCCSSALDSIDLSTVDIATLLNKVATLRVCEGIGYSTKNSFRHVISYRNSDQLLTKDIFRSPDCPVTVDNGTESVCKHCLAAYRSHENLQRSKEAYARKTQELPLQKITANASKSRLTRTLKLRNAELSEIKAKLASLQDCVLLDAKTGTDFDGLMQNEDNSDDVCRLFYSEQVEMQSQQKNARRSHPDIISAGAAEEGSENEELMPPNHHDWDQPVHHGLISYSDSDSSGWGLDKNFDDLLPKKKRKIMQKPEQDKLAAIFTSPDTSINVTNTRHPSPGLRDSAWNCPYVKEELQEIPVVGGVMPSHDHRWPTEGDSRGGSTSTWPECSQE